MNCKRKCNRFFLSPNISVLNLNRKADLPGWSYVIALIISLFVIGLVLFIAFKSKTTILDLLRGL